ncbi:tyrosine-type recombinase/integrase [Pseudomonas syringae]|uniref:Integrase n=1 Tax=Pseudomonas syringae TaxID=317 RepID=A0A085V3T2_PSESX|nr:tyrosine-type recombinase/integrase [Pseudomonas syringae]KFE50095.1 integrase [Pseudomonas syringae]
MARKPVGLPTGVEFAGESIRIRFTWKTRRCETLPYPQTAKGIKSAADLRAHVISLAKHGVLDDARYAELFPRSSYEPEDTDKSDLFGEYAQIWLNGREVVEGTRKNYRISMNLYWMPSLSKLPLRKITTLMLRKIIAATEWKSPTTKRAAIQRLGTLLETALRDGLIERNPAASIELPARVKKSVDPFTTEEADAIISHLYATSAGAKRIYAAYFEFSFYTGMRPGEIAALRWDEIDEDKRVANVCRIVADSLIEERTKTKDSRLVMLNSRAVHAIKQAKEVRTLRESQPKRLCRTSPYVFPPTRNSEFIQQASVTDKHFQQALKDLKVRVRRQYNCRHTYATMCLMAGMNPAFIANQLGHSVQMLLSTYAKWLNSSTDWGELGKLELSMIGTKMVQPEDVPL